MVVLTLLVIVRAREQRRMARAAAPRAWAHPADPAPHWDDEPPYRPPPMPFPPLAAQRPEQYEPPYPPAF
jgi:hypothetical protein